MVNCDWVEKRLSAYIDNELSSQERIAFEAHCDHCNSCRALTAEYQAIGKLMRQSEARVDTTSLWERLEHRLDDNHVVPISTKSQPKNWVYAILATAASVALIWFVAKNPTSNHGDVTLRMLWLLHN